MDFVGALAGIDRFEIGEVAHDGECGRYPIGNEHIARQLRNVERLVRIIALDELDRFRSENVGNRPTGVRMKTFQSCYRGQLSQNPLRLLASV